MHQYKWSYLLARLPIGMSLFGHGVDRIVKLSNFSYGMVIEFARSYVPHRIVVPFSYVLPWMELITGVLLLLGWFTRWALMLGVAIMLALIFGSCLIEEWQNVAIQMFYGLYFAGLYVFIEYNTYSVDGWRLPSPAK